MTPTRVGLVLTAVMCASLVGCGSGPPSSPSAASPPIASVPPTTSTATTPPETAPPSPAATPSPVPPTDRAPSASSEPSDHGARIVNVEIVDERTRDLTIESPSVGTSWARLLLPAGFDAQPDKRWPVLYLLHGCCDTQDAYRSWSWNTDVQALVAPTELLVVMPYGGATGWYSDWWNEGKGGPPMWEQFHLTELRLLLEREWQASEQRVIAGFSMGGYGAMAYAARHPGMFRASASYSGALDTFAIRDFIGQATWGDPVRQQDIWRAHNPLDLAAALDGTALYVSYGDGGRGPLDTQPVRGDDLEPRLAVMNRAFVARLKPLGIPVTVDAYGPGSHDFPYWERALHRSLPMLLEALGEPS